MKRWTKAAYAEYLRSTHWVNKRAEYRASDMPQACVVCGAKRVDLHHRTYDRIGAERLTDLVPLCREHHGEAHRLRRKHHHTDTATARQLRYITLLGGRPSAEMSSEAARRKAETVRADNERRAEMRKRRRKRRQRANRTPVEDWTDRYRATKETA